MASGKKSFILYADIIHTVEKLSDEKAGILFKIILRYVNDLNPESSDEMVDLVFEGIKQQLKRDLRKWEGYIDKQRENGKRGGRPSLNLETQKTQALASQPKKADSVNVNVSVNDNVNVNVNEGDSLVFNAEELVLKNTIQLDRICMKAGNPDYAEPLRKYHLYLEENSKYPKTKKAILAGFEKWLLNEKKFSKNGKQGTSGAGKTIQFDRP